MKRTLPFIAPVVDSTQSAMQRDLYDKSIDLYGEGQYVEAFHTLLDHLNTEFRTKYGNAEGTEFHLPHGSIVVNVRLDDKMMYIDADFLHLPAKGRVAMLRQVADMNINRLLLPRFTKEGDRLKMEYHCPLEETHPHKIVNILQNICRVGDKYDDEFCTKFGATRCYEPRVTPYPSETVDRIYEAIQSLVRATLDAVKEYNDQRRYGYSWNVIDTTFYQISYFAQPQGQLSNDIDKAVDDMDEELPVAELVMKGMAFLQKLLDMPKEKLAEDLYYVDTLVSIKGPSSLQNVQENMKDVYEEATAAMQNKDFERAAVRICYKFYEAYFYNDMQDDLNVIFVKALQEAAEQPMEKAAEILWTALDKIMDGDRRGGCRRVLLRRHGGQSDGAADDGTGAGPGASHAAEDGRGDGRRRDPGTAKEDDRGDDTRRHGRVHASCRRVAAENDERILQQLKTMHHGTEHL